MAKRSTSLRPSPADEASMRAIRERWGAPSDNAAVVLALRVVAQAGDVAPSLEAPEEPSQRLLVVRLSPDDDAAIRVLRERWGLGSDAAAISFALRVLADCEGLMVVPRQ